MPDSSAHAVRQTERDHIAKMKILDWLRRYTSHPDPQAAAANWVAVVVGWNTPFYPLYLLAMPGQRHLSGRAG